MIRKTGVPSKEQVLSVFPAKSILIKPKAIIECYQEIPCNPCSTACPVGAIKIGNDINQIPLFNETDCTGCSNCISVCPGQAIMVTQIVGDKAIFKIPYEFLPLPSVNDIWDGLNREGEFLTKVLIKNVKSAKSYDKTKIITVEADIQYLYEFKTIRCPNGK